MAGVPQKQRTVELQDPDGSWTKAVLEAAEALAGKSLEVKGTPGHRYFVAPSPELARLCRRWLTSPLPDLADARVSHGVGPAQGL